MRIAVPSTALVLASSALAALAAPAGAQTPSTPPDACKEALDTGARESYRFKDGRRTWTPGRVVVTPTKADEDRYCIEVRFGGQSVIHESSTKGWERRNGRWVVIGGDGGGGDRQRSYTRTAQIQERRRVEFRFDVRIQGREYRAAFRRQNL